LPRTPDQSAQRQPPTELDDVEVGSRTCAEDRAGHDFSQIPVHPKFRPIRIPESGSTEPRTVHEVAMTGVRGQGAALPYLDSIQRSFGCHDVTSVRAHSGPEASRAAQAIHASAYTIGTHVAFDGPPDLFTAAHEAAHVVQQRAGVQLPGEVSEAGDRYEQHADVVAARVVAGQPVEALLELTASGDFQPTQPTHAPRPTLQREEAKKAKTGVEHAVTAAEVTTTIDLGLAQIDESLVKGTKSIRLAIRNDAEFVRAWQDYADRSGTPGASMGGELNGFVDPTHPDGKTGFVRASAGVGTAIHEAMHQRASPRFFTGRVGENINEGTTELFTRVVIAYAGGKIERNVYEEQKRAMLRLQGISGLAALAQWYCRGDASAVEKALGSRLEQFMYWMDSKELELDAASRADSAIKAL
jgi:uncharacterized protein DUF4157